MGRPPVVSIRSTEEEESLLLFVPMDITRDLYAADSLRAAPVSLDTSVCGASSPACSSEQLLSSSPMWWRSVSSSCRRASALSGRSGARAGANNVATSSRVLPRLWRSWKCWTRVGHRGLHWAGMGGGANLEAMERGADSWARQCLAQQHS